MRLEQGSDLLDGRRYERRGSKSRSGFNAIAKEASTYSGNWAISPRTSWNISADANISSSMVRAGTHNQMRLSEQTRNSGSGGNGGPLFDKTSLSVKERQMLWW